MDWSFFQINGLARRFPGLMTLRSVDLSPASWMAVAWSLSLSLSLSDFPCFYLCFCEVWMINRMNFQVPNLPYSNGENHKGLINMLPDIPHAFIFIPRYKKWRFYALI